MVLLLHRYSLVGDLYMQHTSVLKKKKKTNPPGAQKITTPFAQNLQNSNCDEGLVTMEAAEEELERRSKFLNSLILKKKAVEQKEQHERLNVRVRASDMAVNLQNYAFRCARGNLDSMPKGKLDSKRLALSLKKVQQF